MYVVIEPFGAVRLRADPVEKVVDREVAHRVAHEHDGLVVVAAQLLDQDAGALKVVVSRLQHGRRQTPVVLHSPTSSSSSSSSS